MRALMSTCREIRVEGKEREEKALTESGGKAVYATWHQRMSYHARHFARRDVTLLISQSRDGEYGARVARWLGFRSVRGSSTRGGAAALRQLIKGVRAHAFAGVFADGPRGPARVAKMGALVMARASASPLIPVAWGADRCWILHTWDRYLIPKPFARVVVYYAEPIRVPPSAKKETLEDFRRLLEGRLNEAARWCDLQFGDERPWRKVTEAGIPEIGPLEDRAEPAGGGG
jgi:lysophospholipid acyltransferase (LPLAT)-like uncharacterized protein